MKIKLSRKAAKLISVFLGRTSLVCILKLCEELDVANGSEVDSSLYELYHKLDEKLQPKGKQRLEKKGLA